MSLSCLQEDDNFVLYGWSPVWASDTSGLDGVRVCMQADCNLVMYNQQSEAKWHTNSAKGAGSMCRLHLTNDGKLLEAERGVSHPDNQEFDKQLSYRCVGWAKSGSGNRCWEEA
ncbi:Mannose-specific lectin [Liparis tanakae]|uniref:Mannose-specific lectin n=1 Tax=Liparis tanakae TaxID=230148 RepID=A0A4Z2EFQ2_9TELE|nr:Mannose-specific lectin [Liparis tanakae]